MKKYSIPIVWQSYKRYNVEAESLEIAIEEALSRFLSEPDDTYIQDSFEIDGIIEDEYPDESYDMSKILNNL